MRVGRTRLLVAGAAATMALAAGAWGPAQAYATHETTCTEDPTICAQPNYICVGDVCVYSIDNGMLTYMLHETERDAREAMDGAVQAAREGVDAVYGMAVDAVYEVLDQEVCVPPADPNQPICIRP